MTKGEVERGRWPMRQLPASWSWAEFATVFENVTSSDRKLKQEQYAAIGRFPVVDQGSDLIGGFTDDEGLVHPDDPPFLVFGDHTRCLKYVDTPFVQGADGVKVLKVRGIESRYALWALRTLRLPDRGYSRHFQFLRNSEFPIAPPPEQLRIVAKIEELFSDLDAGVAALERVKAKLKRYRAAVLKAAVEGRLTAEWRRSHPATEPADKLLERILADRRRKWEEAQLRKFAEVGKAPPKGWKEKYKHPALADTGSLHQLPKGWAWAIADQLCSQVTDGEHIQPPYQPSGKPMLTATHVRDDGVRFENVGLIAEDNFQKCLKRCAPMEGDLLIVSVGATTGRAAVVGPSEPFAIVRSVLLLKPLILSKYLLRWVQSPWCHQWIGRASGASAQAHFYISDAKRMPAPLPPASELSEIVAEVDRRVSVVEAVEAEVEHGLKRAARLRQAILKLAFAGKLVPRDPADEPASKLLERIRAQRAEENHKGPGSGRRKPRTAHTRRRARTVG
ncbi:MAG TPA: hypothetical protein VJZ71_20410 [Phycisphaerae bacterium]|nr:hypothetical protein [Phycisphaerae bacterium]